MARNFFTFPIYAHSRLSQACARWFMLELVKFYRRIASA